MADYLLAIDLGTSGVKVGAIDLEGRMLGFVKETYPTANPQPGYYEQDPRDWWAACTKAIRQVLAFPLPSAGEGTGVRGPRAVCVTGLAPALVCVDEHGQPLMPSPIWRDRHDQAEQAELSAATNQPRVDKVLSWLLWCKRRRPEVYAKTHWVLQSYEYLGFCLTGISAAIPLVSTIHQSFRQAIERAGLDVGKFPDRVALPGDRIGTVSPEVADALGLDRDVPVIAGGMDAFASWIGTATLRKGQACNTAGTTNSVGIAWDQPLVDPQRRVGSLPNVLVNNWTLAGATSNGSNVIHWLIRVFYGSADDAMDRLFAEAMTVSAGADGLIALPYLEGERAPLHDPHARAAFFGITSSHGRPHFARAMLEAIAFSVRDVMAVLEEIGATVEDVRIAGPAGQNLAWSQIRADVLDKPVIVPEIGESGLLGAAMIAAIGVGAYADVEKAAAAMVRQRARLEPNTGNHERYTLAFEVYRDLQRAEGLIPSA
jgi:xylulokinase